MDNALICRSFRTEDNHGVPWRFLSWLEGIGYDYRFEAAEAQEPGAMSTPVATKLWPQVVIQWYTYPPVMTNIAIENGHL